MWRDAILRRLALDVLPLRRRGETFTWKTLEELHRRLAKATVYPCGTEADVEAALLARERPDARPSLFGPEGDLLPLPQAHMLLEFSAGADAAPRAALLTDQGDRIEMYVFRLDAARNRWRWPLLGMAYGPRFENNARVAVHDPAALAAASKAATAAMLREHLLGARVAVACLELVRAGLAAPEGEPGPSAAELAAKRAPKAPLPTPPSLARAGRTRHEAGPAAGGARRA